VLLATVVFVTAAFYFRAVPPEVILVLAVAAITSLLMSGGSAFWTHVARRAPGATFIYLQALFDLVLVTTVVHLTGGPDSDFASLYIAVIAYAAVLLPLASSLLVTILASITYVADIVWGHPTQLTLAVWLQIGVFLAVAVATGWLASRVRVVGQEREVLQREVKRLRLEAGDILRNIGSGVVTVDGDGHLVYANPSAEALLDFRASEWAGRPVLSFLDARSHELAAAITRTQETGVRTFRAEGDVLAGARTVPIGMTTTALHVEGQETPSVTAIFTDISDQKRLDELNLRAERLEAVAELSASLAHEIKNPLASIRSSVEQLARMAPDSGAGDDERFLGQLVIRESDRLSRLLNEFLDFARVRVAMSRPVDLTQVSRAAAEVVRQHPACRDDTSIRVAGDALTVEGDEDLLHRVVTNLVLNAVQAGDGRVQVSVEVREARLDELPRGVTLQRPVLLRVADNGPGIPAELRDRLFDPFVTGRAGGSGLGLAVVQRAVQAHRGYVFVESTAGRGTTFTVFLPARGSREAAA
jgi:two-component system sensor histidine kinase PilS (NtrC family)